MHLYIKLTTEEAWAMKSQFPTGRPLEFSCEAQSGPLTLHGGGGISLAALISNIFGKLFGWTGVVEDTPNWLKARCEKARQEIVSAGLLHGTVKDLLTGIEFQKEGTLFKGNEKDGTRRVAFLAGTDYEEVFFIAAWDSATLNEILRPF